MTFLSVVMIMVYLRAAVGKTSLGTGATVQRCEQRRKGAKWQSEMASEKRAVLFFYFQILQLCASGSRRPRPMFFIFSNVWGKLVWGKVQRCKGANKGANVRNGKGV